MIHRSILLRLVVILFAALYAHAVDAQTAQSPPRVPHYWYSGPGDGWNVLPLRYRKSPDIFCDSGHCYAREHVGFGLLPKRSYRVVFAQDQRVCATIEQALNWALTRSNAELEKVWAGVPDPIAVMNPIFSSPVFLRWHHLKNVDFAGSPGQERQPWMIVPFLNDGIPRLLTDRGRGQPTLWRYSSEDLEADHWDDFRNYDRRREIPDKESPLRPVMYYKPPKEPPETFGFPAVYQFPNLPKALWNSPVWKYSARYGAVEIVFAKVGGRIFLVSHDGLRDTMYVADVSKEPGDDICYFDSTISKSLASR